MAEKAHFEGKKWAGNIWKYQDNNKRIESHWNPSLWVEKMGGPPTPLPHPNHTYQPYNPPLMELNIQRHIFSIFEQPFKTDRRLRHSNASARPKVIGSRVTPWQLHSPVSATRYLCCIPVVILSYNPPARPPHLQKSPLNDHLVRASTLWMFAEGRRRYDRSGGNTCLNIDGRQRWLRAACQTFHWY